MPKGRNKQRKKDKKTGQRFYFCPQLGSIVRNARRNEHNRQRHSKCHRQGSGERIQYACQEIYAACILAHTPPRRGACRCPGCHTGDVCPRLPLGFFSARHEGFCRMDIQVGHQRGDAHWADKENRRHRHRLSSRPDSKWCSTFGITTRWATTTLRKWLIRQRRQQRQTTISQKKRL